MKTKAIPLHAYYNPLGSLSLLLPHALPPCPPSPHTSISLSLVLSCLLRAFCQHKYLIPVHCTERPLWS